MELPSATVRISDTAGPAVVGTQLLCVIAAVPLHADSVPRQWGNIASLYAYHGYAQGVDFSSTHIGETKKPVLFCGVPIATPGTVGQFDASGNTGTSVVSVAADSSGSLDEIDGWIRVDKGGTVGTDPISISISYNAGRSWVTGIRLGTATTYTIPYVGQVLSFTVGTLVAGDIVLKWHSTAPMWDNAGLTAAFTALKKQLRQVIKVKVIGDLTDATFAGYVVNAVNDYETSTNRYVVAKCDIRDRLPLATLSHVLSRMTASNVTFAEVGDTGDTITRSTGSFVTDGFASGDTIRVSGSVSNNVSGVPATIAASVITLASTDLVAEGPVSGVVITAEPTITFVDGGGSADTITRNRGSWLSDGFRTGQTITISGTASNNYSAVLTNVSATTLTVATGTVTAEVIGSSLVTLVAGETVADWQLSVQTVFASIAAQKRVDLGVGRGFKLSRFLNSELRRGANWADMIQSFQHDLHVATWAKAFGPLNGWSLLDTAGNLVEYDDDFYTGMTAAGFTCFRSWSNGPIGAFIARSVTRADPTTKLTATENMYVACLAQAVCQLETENAIGADLVLKADDSGNATPESLQAIKQRVDSALQRNLLANVQGEGARASAVYWTPSADDDLSGDDATLNGVLTLVFKGKVAHINTVVKV